MKLVVRLLSSMLGAAYVVAFLTGVGCSSPPPPEHEAKGLQLFESPQADPIVLSADGTRLYAVVTTTGRVRVINTANMNVVATIDVGVDPVSLALRPDGSELWVANHVSDSVSVISLAPGPRQHKVVETIQAIDAANLISDFDEPVGIAFANNAKAYVALSSRNQIAIVDANGYAVTGFLAINAQEPRAMRVRDGRLFVPAFESGNRSELSSCAGAPVAGDPQCTFDFTQANFAQNPQLVGFDVDIAKDPLMPDRDLYVFDTTTNAQVAVVSGIGTLLYGVTVDSNGKVFIAQTDARNADNGRAGTGTPKQGLADLDNRMFLNQIGVVDCGGGSCDAPARFELEPLPPAQPAAGEQLATPYALEISADDQLLVGTAASSNRVFVANAGTGAVLARIDVGNGPRGIALRSDPGSGAPVTAYVLNTLDDSISKIDLSDLGDIPAPTTRVYNGDATPLAIRNGRIAFNSAAASTTGTFSCASCHPDGHVDQLLWVIGAQCTFSGCDQEEPRTTMPVRGLKNTLPLHWDGTLGDPFNGRNGETGINATAPKNCTEDQECFRHLVNASLSGVMCDQAGGCPTNDVAQPGGLSDAEREDMATYLQSIQYPPARTRRFDDQLTAQAVAGFSDFFENKGGVNPPGGNELGPETCGDVGGGGCHALPHGVGTASFFVGGFEAPTMRGITDRFVQFSAGVTVVRDILQAISIDPPGPAGPGTEAPWSPAIGFDEFTTWAVAFGSPSNNIAFRAAYNVAAFDIFQMIEEMSTGQSGALGRQLTLNLRSTAPGALPETQAVLAVLEAADLNGVVNLQGSGERNGAPLTLSFRSDGSYRGGGLTLTRAQLISEAQAGTTTLTLAALQRASVNAATVQPTLFVKPAFATGSGGTFLNNGRPDLPLLPGDDPMDVLAEDVPPGAKVLIDGLPVAATATCIGAVVNGFCDEAGIRIDLLAPPTQPGLYLLQVQTSDGLLSNELPIRRE
jgi:DNA-binding beta-propeller fold protein YncE